MYHVLEGPAMAAGEGEKPTQDKATVYVVYEEPVPSKPLKNN